VEVQAKPDPELLDRLGEYAFRLRRELRDGSGAPSKYPVLCLVLNLTGAEQTSRLDMAVPEWSDAGLSLQVAQGTLSTQTRAGRWSASRAANWNAGCYHAVENRVGVHDLQATILHQLGLNHEKLTFRFQGRDYRLTDVSGEVVTRLLA
jgi:hypothetical protein